MGNSDNKRPWYAVEDGHAQVGDGQVDQEVVGQTPHSTVGEHCPQHLESRDHDNLRIRVPHYLVDRLAILETFGYNSKIHLRRKLLATFWGGEPYQSVAQDGSDQDDREGGRPDDVFCIPGSHNGQHAS